ncbi:hypothetical protein Q5Y75_05730 [Ruegeria sp. 2205SS24-7]|uniref:hypothetical protein n=1 Tax=Ruegeria discodermiae TaxID=3064389 RepID=UPI002741DA6D|nr:hypothetical protein [Ruegeria sp. 2205SS24-7]MDP5216711.1 hypothetical protein [Ruegeria sp. 2205SS24-7]
MSVYDRKQRETFLTQKITGYLDRKSPPRNLGARAQADEMQSLVRCFMRYAPRDRFEEWWPRFEDRLDEDAKTRAWPTAGEVKAAATAIAGPSSKRPAQGDEIDPLDIYAKRMERGEPVPDGCFYGRIAVDMQARGLVNSDTLRKYRSAWYFKLKAQYDEEYARQKEDAAKALHESIEADDRQPAGRPVPKPEPQKMKAYDWDGAQ